MFSWLYTIFTSLWEFISHSLFQVAPLIILALIAVELASLRASRHSFSVLFAQIKRAFTFTKPWTSISIFLWISIAFFSLSYSIDAPGNPFPPATAGVLLFLMGWLMRYQHNIVRVFRNSRRIRGYIARYVHYLNEFELFPPRAELLGPSLEIIGIAVISRSFTFIPAFFIFPAVLLSNIIRDSKKAALANHHFSALHFSDVFPKLIHIALIFSISWIFALLVGLGIGEFYIFYADASTAISLLFALSQIEGSIGILVITIIFVLTQLTASNYSPRIPAMLFRQQAFYMPLIMLVTSISFNLLVASRSATIFPAGNFRSLFMDFSFVLAIATACSITFFIFQAPKMVSPETIIARSLKSFDEEWLETIKRDWCRPNFELKLDVRFDPFIVVERILSRAVDSGDNLTFISGLILIRDHLYKWSTIDPKKLPDYLIELDAYLRHHLRSLVRTAAKNSDAYTLLQLVYFIERIGIPSPNSIQKCDNFAFDSDEAPAELLLREIIRNAAIYQLTECVTRAIHVVESRATKVIENLPKQEDTWQFNQMKTEPQVSKEQQEKLWANDRRVDRFERQYLSYLSDMGVKAADSKSEEIVRAVFWSLNNIISSVIQCVDGNIMKTIIVREAVWNLYEVAKATDRNKLSDTMSLSMLKYAAEKIKPENEETVAWNLVNYVSDFLENRAKLGLLSFGDVIEAAMLGLAIAEKYTKPATHLLESMGKAGLILKEGTHYNDDKDIKPVYRQLVGRIRQVGYDGQKKDPEQMSATAKNILGRLGESESEEKSGG